MEHDDELVPPTAERVAHRALALACTSCRGFIEEDAQKPEAEQFRQQVLDWSMGTGLAAEFEDWEESLLRTPLGQAPDQQVATNALWAGEGLVVLAWALGRHDMPAYDDSPLPAHVAQSVGFLQDQSETVLNQPTLRDHAEISRLGDFMFALHWRLRQFHLDRQPIDFKKTARTAWFGPLDTEGMRFIDDDLALRGASVSECDPNLFAACLSMTMERHRAVNWLLGHSEVYFDTDTST